MSFLASLLANCVALHNVPGIAFICQETLLTPTWQAHYTRVVPESRRLFI